MLFGLMVMGFGLLFLLRNLNVIYIDDIWQYWPVILIVIGGSKLLSPRGAYDIFPGLIIGGIGTFFLLRNLGIIYGNIWQWFWPMLLIGFGASMLIRHMDGNDRSNDRGWREGHANATPPESPLLNVDAVFNQVHRKVETQKFTGGKISGVFADVKIDLRGSAMEMPEVTIKVDSVFSGVELIVPEAWDVDVRGNGAFGSTENKTQKPQFVGGVTPKRLIVLADAVFASVIVKN